MNGCTSNLFNNLPNITKGYLELKRVSLRSLRSSVKLRCMLIMLWTFKDHPKSTLMSPIVTWRPQNPCKTSCAIHFLTALGMYGRISRAITLLSSKTSKENSFGDFVEWAVVDIQLFGLQKDRYSIQHKAKNVISRVTTKCANFYSNQTGQN